MTGTAYYIRQSEDKTGDAVAIERQEQDCLQLAALKGWGTAERFADNSISATNGKTRPEFERLLTEIAAGRVTRLVVWHSDRLTRSMSDLLRLLEASNGWGVSLAAVRGPSMDLNDPTGVGLAQIITAVAGMETAHKGERQKRANRQRAEAGNAFWSRRPFGYDRLKDGTVVTIQHEADAIKKAADLVLGGATMSSVVRSWNDAGLRTTDVRSDSSGALTKNGGLWGVTQLRRLLLNPRYAGKRIYNGEDMGAGEWEPILTAEQHQALEVFLTDPRRRTAPVDLNARYLLSGVLTCGKCQRKLYAAPVKSRGREWMVYRCLGGYCLSRRLDLVDEAVEGVVVARLVRPDAAQLFRSGDDVVRLRDRAAELRKRRDAVAEMVADGLTSPGTGRELAAKLTNQLNDVSADIDAAGATNPAAALLMENDVAAAWAALPVGNKRRIIRALIDVTLMPAGKGVRFSAEQLRLQWKG
ncbi:recombinase family protein [Arthrobacter burdickii]|uniref:Recombinase family protein n=1 Tax=Arthrobacter burdickii TaxID=3035920 RepID=A0ABT8K3A8_9MICC|nr:recombinase family protein [Arthrobacter burdickii]MDN4611072.1 recombinase family protein [Arthrobacter burdickii]